MTSDRTEPERRVIISKLHEGDPNYDPEFPWQYRRTIGGVPTVTVGGFRSRQAAVDLLTTVEASYARSYAHLGHRPPLSPWEKNAIAMNESVAPRPPEGDEMFEILKHLRDINTLRPIDWDISAGVGVGGVMVMAVRIPLSAEDAEFIQSMQELFK